jgi:hypothetical protein
MAEKYQNKYRITSARLKNWDYASCAAYFITICTANREHFLGQIIGGKMNLSVLGSVVEQEWIKTIEIRPDMNLSLGDYVVMPNHFHGIIFIGANEFNTNGNSPVIGMIVAIIATVLGEGVAGQVYIIAAIAVASLIGLMCQCILLVE